MTKSFRKNGVLFRAGQNRKPALYIITMRKIPVFNGDWKYEPDGFKSLRSLHFAFFIINHLQQFKLLYGVFPERFLKDSPLIRGESQPENRP